MIGRPAPLWRIQQAITANGARQSKEEAMRRVAVFTVLLSGFCVMPPMPESFAQQVAGNQIEPRAGSWKTWVISSGREFRVAPPPNDAATAAEIDELKRLASKRDATAKDLIAYWNVGPPSYRWHEIALSEAMRNNLSWNFAMRHFALLHVAIYDALVAAWDSKYEFNRKRPSEVDGKLTTELPNPRSPSYPAEHAVAAGAAAEVLSYIFPDRASDFAAKAAEAGRSRALAGVQYPSDISAGLELGRQVAARVIERGKADGSDAKWTGNVPTGPGKWNGTNPILPQMATWKPWVLASANEFRSPPPIAHDSPEKAAELVELKTFPRTPKTNAAANFWEYAAGGLRAHHYWSWQIGRLILEYRLDDNPPLAARAYALQNITSLDAGIACWDSKYAYWAIRPVQLDPDVKPLFSTPNHPSYPAAHGCLSTATATILGYLFPRDTAKLAALGEEAAESRIWAGIHYRSDTVAGTALGRAVANKVIDRARKDGSQ
jgi:membrane-associated phospholipid phosphatase